MNKEHFLGFFYAPLLNPLMTSKHYWPSILDTQVLAYRTAQTQEQRDTIYRTYLHTPLVKLVGCIVHRYMRTDEDSASIQEDALHHAVLQLDKYHTGKGKSFSYFTVIVRNYMWQHNQKRHAAVVNHINIQGIECMVGIQAEDIYWEEEKPTAYQVPYPEQLKVYPNDDQRERTVNAFLQYIQTVDTCGGNKPRDKEIVFAIRHLMTHINDYDIIHKKALFMDLRNRTGYKTTHIHKVIERIHRNYTKYTKK